MQKGNKIDPALKEKAKACLILYRIRQHQDPQTMNTIIKQLSSVENAKDKISLSGITHCYSTITDEQIKLLLDNVQNQKSINSLSEENVQLLSLENIGQVDFDSFSDSIQEFFEVFKELMAETKKEEKVKNTTNEDESKSYEEDKPFYETNIFIIIAIIFGINICFIFYQCMKVGNRQKQNNADDKNINKDKRPNDKDEENKSGKDGKTTKVE